MDRYPATYTDAHGSETTAIDNDGETLRLSVRGVEFVGSDFDSFEPKEAAPEQLRPFTLNQGCLCSCRIECRIPIPVHEGGELLAGSLSVELVLGDPAANGGIDREVLGAVLEYDGQQVVGPGTSGWFEDELLGIQSQLPERVFIKACINCLYSDYSPYGHGLFGSMMCFRNLKSEYLNVRTKQEFWSVHGRQDRFVQETYLCPEFEQRIPGTGYRG
ncbi:MAG: DUF6304 family protein [Pirellulaceae bacterium]